MSAQDKVIKISFAVDPSLATAKRAIEDITAAVKNLVTESGKLGGIFGGGGGGRATALPPVPGRNPSTQIAHNAAGAGASNAMKGLTTAATGTAGVFKSAAEASKLAFKSMTEGFTKMVDQHEAQVQRLEKIMTRYNTAVGKTTPGGGSAGGGGGGGAAAAAAANGGAAAVQAARLGGGGGGAAGGGGGGGGLFGGGNGGMIFGNSGVLAGIAGRLGIPAGALGGAGALTAGITAGNFATGSAYENQLANINMMVDRPTFMAEGRASMGRIFGGNAQAIRHGDMYRGYAQAQLAKDETTREMLSQDILLEGRRHMENPTTLGGHTGKSGIITGAGNRMGASAGAAANEATSGRMGAGDNHRFREAQALMQRGRETGGARGAAMISQAKQEMANIPAISGGGAIKGSISGTFIDAKIETERTDIISLKRSQNQQMALQAQRQQEQLERKMAEDPRTQEQMNSQYASSLGDAATMRSLGMSGRQIYVKGGPATGYDAGSFMRAKAFDQARDVSEFGAAAQELGAVAGRGFLSKYGATLGAKTGGLHNAAQILGVGAQFGGGTFAGGKAFMGGIQGKIGARGVDITAGSQLAGFGMGSMTASNFVGTTGSGLMGTLLDAAYTGTTGGDMRKARELAGGMEFREQRAGGGIDSLNKALNLSAAMKAAPEAPWTVRNTLASMQDASILDIIKTGKVPSILADNGVTADMVQKYYSATNMTKFARFGSAAEYGTEDQRAAVARYREAGGVGYMKGMSKSARERETNLLAGAYATGTGTTLTKARADIEIEESAAGLLGSGRRAGGARDSFDMNSTAGKAAQAKAIIEMTDGVEKAHKREMFEKQFGMAPEQMIENDVARRRGQAGMTPGGDVGAAIGGVSQALTAFVDAMKSEFGGGGSKKSGGAPAAAGPS